MSLKEKVRANIYKTLLEEEKRKNKRMSIFSVGLFFVGIVTMSTYNSLSINSIDNSIKSLVLNKESEEEIITKLYNTSDFTNKKVLEMNPDELFTFNTQI